MVTLVFIKMTIDKINVTKALEEAKKLLKESKEEIPTAVRASFTVLLTLVEILVSRLGLNSKNSSKPPSTDPNRLKNTRKKSGKKPGGQPGHNGSTLERIDDPDEIEEVKINRRALPKGKKFKQLPPQTRQVFDIIISRFVTEYRAEVLEDEDGKQYVAPFPEGVDRAVQYGETLKAHAVYLSQYQLLPFERVKEYFHDQVGIPLSKGSLGNFNKEGYDKLESFEGNLKKALINSKIVHADETSINIGGKRHWLHGNSNEKYTYLYPHKKRGILAMNEMDVLPHFRNKLCHDHWLPYFTYAYIFHILCNAHHLRELERVWEQDGQKWAGKLKKLLLAMNEAVNEAGGALRESEAEKWRICYRGILKDGETECPPSPPGKNKDGTTSKRKPKQSEARNLLERLRDFEVAVLEFLIDPDVPFTNNLGERDIRMTKVQQKISGCFRSPEGAKYFCRIRSYLSTCKKNDISASEALSSLFAKKQRDPIFCTG